jgi:transcriptional regulator with XRE-family HTH domain
VAADSARAGAQEYPAAVLPYVRSRLENKNPPRPSAEKLSAIAGALGVTVDYLIGSDAQTLDEAEDTAFFRQYSSLPEKTRRQIREMARILDTKKRK